MGRLQPRSLLFRLYVEAVVCGACMVEGRSKSLFPQSLGLSQKITASVSFAAWRKQKMRKGVFAMLLVLLLGASNSLAQKLTGGIYVQVLDPGGAAVAEVKASVINDERGTKLDVLGSSDGVVNVPDLAPGAYKVMIQRDGVKTTTTTV